MSSPPHVVVHAGKADSDVPDYNAAFFDQIEGLRSEQIHLSQQLVSERTANSLVRKDLALVESVYLECIHLRNESMKKLSDARVSSSRLQLDIAELHGVLKDEEAYLDKMADRIAELKRMNEMAANALRLHLQRTSPLHASLRESSQASPATQDAEFLIAEVARLKHENHILKTRAAKLDIRLMETVRETEEDKRRLELTIADSKTRLASLKEQLERTDSTQVKQLKEIEAAIEVQLATNDALRADIQAAERGLFGSETLQDERWPEL